MNLILQKSVFVLCSFFLVLFSQAQITDTYTSSTSWVVPAGVNTVSIKVYGGGGGTGGQDCGAGCTNAAGGNTGYVVALFAVTAGNTIGIYPGGKGSNGTNNATGTGGGGGGVASYGAAYNGGNGGNAGPTGASGGGGGGGAATVVTINSVIKIVAGGAGGGGGMANLAASGYAGNATTSPNGTSNTGGSGTTPGGDGGGGGGGGGGVYGSLGGGVHAASTESAGDGGYVGGNSISGASSVTSNGTIAWTNGGQIEISYINLLPVNWLSFYATRQNTGAILLNWSTATEINNKEFIVQRSSTGSDWSNLGTLPATGNSSTQRNYSFTDAAPNSTVNHYRILQRDMNGKEVYSNVLVLRAAAEGGLKIYPNPVTNGNVTVQLPHAATVKIYNSTGLVVLQNNYKAGTHIINLWKLPKGAYYLNTTAGSTSFIIQ